MADDQETLARIDERTKAMQIQLDKFCEDVSDNYATKNELETVSAKLEGRILLSLGPLFSQYWHQVDKFINIKYNIAR
jgi:hypothetical protein